MTSKRAAIAALLTLFVFGLGIPAASADQVIFVVRHAERADGGAGTGGMIGTNDPPLSAEGTERARRLATHLASADVKHIFTTEFQRTRDTAGPVAQKAGIKAVVVSSRDPAALLRQVREARDNVLIVGHSNTVPDVLKQLGVTSTVSIADNEYDNLFVVVRPATGEPALIRLRY